MCYKIKLLSIFLLQNKNMKNVTFDTVAIKKKYNGKPLCQRLAPETDAITNVQILPWEMQRVTYFLIQMKSVRRMKNSLYFCRWCTYQMSFTWTQHLPDSWQRWRSSTSTLFGPRRCRRRSSLPQHPAAWLDRCRFLFDHLCHRSHAVVALHMQ